MSGTIFALASAAGRSGLAVLRISGPGTRGALAQLLRPGTYARVVGDPRRLVRAALAHRQEPLDSGLVVFFRGPASYTGEDVAELHVHGAPAVLRALCACLASLGLRMALPGEFSQRAFLAGKLGLDEVEALADLVAAETDAQRRQALWAMSSERAAVLRGWRDRTVAAMAGLEAWIDFAEDEQIDAAHSRDAVLASLAPLQAEIAARLHGDRDAELVRSGLHIVIAGRPNAGKSSLLNRLAGRRAAIVAPTPGTTRDLISVAVELGGHRVTFTDTAGLRESADPVEQEGVRLARDAIAQADYVLHLMDGTAGPAELLPGDPRVITVHSKADLPGAAGPWRVSTASEPLFAAFQAQLAALIAARMHTVTRDLPVLVQERHRQCLADALAALGRAAAAVPADVVIAAEHLRCAATHIGRVSGHAIDHEHVLDTLFASFCIGK